MRPALSRPSSPCKHLLLLLPADTDAAPEDPGQGCCRGCTGTGAQEPAAHVPYHGCGWPAAPCHVLAHIPPHPLSAPPLQKRASCLEALAHSRLSSPFPKGVWVGLQTEFWCAGPFLCLLPPFPLQDRPGPCACCAHRDGWAGRLGAAPGPDNACDSVLLGMAACGQGTLSTCAAFSSFVSSSLINRNGPRPIL